MKYQHFCFWAQLGPNLVPTWSPIFPFKNKEKSTFLRFGPHLYFNDISNKTIKTNEISTFLLLRPSWSQLGPGQASWRLLVALDLSKAVLTASGPVLGGFWPALTPAMVLAGIARNHEGPETP